MAPNKPGWCRSYEKACIFQVQNASCYGDASMPVVTVLGEPLPVGLKEHSEIMKEGLLYMKTKSFKLDRQTEETVTFLCTENRKISGPKMTILLRMNNELVKQLRRSSDNLNTQMQNKSYTSIIIH